jgi:ABC-type glycerol-3-phosphate transport system permease component
MVAADASVELRQRSLHRRKVIWRILNQWPVVVIFVLLVFMMAPYGVAIIISGKTQQQFEVNPFGIILPFYFHQTYATAFRVVVPYILNSLIVSTLSCVGVLFFGSLAAYVFARFEFPGRELLFLLILALLMIPGILTLVPRFVIVKSLGLYNTRWALLLPYIAGGQVMAVFLLRTFMAGLPPEYFESARMDGASEIRCYWNIALPLCASILGVVAILQVLSTWNDLFWPYLTTGTQEHLWTIPVGLLALSRGGQADQQIGVRMAGYVLSALPLVALFAFTSRLFVEGLTSGGLKL